MSYPDPNQNVCVPFPLHLTYLMSSLVETGCLGGSLCTECSCTGTGVVCARGCSQDGGKVHGKSELRPHRQHTPFGKTDSCLFMHTMTHNFPSIRSHLTIVCLSVRLLCPFLVSDSRRTSARALSPTASTCLTTCSAWSRTQSSSATVGLPSTCT